jgi:hypothetical protein
MQCSVLCVLWSVQDGVIKGGYGEDAAAIGVLSDCVHECYCWRYGIGAAMAWKMESEEISGGGDAQKMASRAKY